MESIISQWLSQIDNFIENSSKEEKLKIWVQVKEMGLKGPSMYNYFHNVIENQPIEMIFDKNILFNDDEPPTLEFFNPISETPKFNLESFFCNIAKWITLSRLRFN